MALRTELQLMLQAARMYYVDGLNQQEVGNNLNLSRQKVSRLLADARAKGIVQISLIDPFESDQGLEARFQEVFGLRAVVLTPNEGLNGAALRQRIGVAAAEYLSHALHDWLSVGIGWGQTLYSAVTALGKEWRAAIDVVPLVGGMGQMAPSFQVNELARQLAEAFNGTWHPMYIPAFTGDRQAHDALMRLEDVQAMARLWREVRVAIVGIGPFAFQRRSSMFFGGGIPQSMLPKLEAGGAVGDICARFFDADGRPVTGEPGVIGISLEELNALDDVVAIAGGAEKVLAILGAIRGGYVKTLVTDSVTAQAVLEQHSRRN